MALVRSIDKPWEEIRLVVDFDFEVNSVNTVIQYRPREEEEFSGDAIAVDELPRYLFELPPYVSTPEKGLPRMCIFRVRIGGRYRADFGY